MLKQYEYQNISQTQKHLLNQLFKVESALEKESGSGWVRGFGVVMEGLCVCKCVSVKR
jgi:hypothetical protein